MEKVKLKIFQYLSGLISIDEFAAWLYQDTFVSNNIDDELIFELVNINLKSKFAHHEIKKIREKYFNGKEFILFNIIGNLESIVSDDSDNNIEKSLKNMECYYNEWYEFGLMSQVYSLSINWDLGIDNVFDKEQVRFGIITESKLIFEKLSNASYDEQIVLLENGYYTNVIGETNISRVRNKLSKTKKWFEFWK